MCDPILVTLLKMQPHYSQSSRENATPSSGTSPVASYKEVPPPRGRKTWTATPFSRRNSNLLLDFSLQRKEGQSIGPLFRSAWKNLQTLRSNSNDFCFTDRGFNFPARRVIIPRTTAQLEINISDRSCVTNATYRTGTRQLGIWLYFNGNFSLCTRPVSHICHAGAVANVDFKLCRSSWAGWSLDLPQVDLMNFRATSRPRKFQGRIC